MELYVGGCVLGCLFVRLFHMIFIFKWDSWSGWRMYTANIQNTSNDSSLPRLIVLNIHFRWLQHCQLHLLQLKSLFLLLHIYPHYNILLLFHSISLTFAFSFSARIMEVYSNNKSNVQYIYKRMAWKAPRQCSARPRPPVNYEASRLEMEYSNEWKSATRKGKYFANFTE